MSNQNALSLASMWNFAVNALKSLAEGNNRELFFKVYTPLQNFVDSQSYIF
jgi:hypothetical protein